MDIKLEDLQKALAPHNLEIVSQAFLKRLEMDFYLHEYASYEEYRKVQILHNKRKINNVWADQKTLDLVVQRVQEEFPGKKLKALCHGTRNGFEQNYLVFRV